MKTIAIIEKHIQEYEAEMAHIDQDIELYRANNDPFGALTQARVLAMVKRDALQKVLKEAQSV